MQGEQRGRGLSISRDADTDTARTVQHEQRPGVTLTAPGAESCSVSHSYFLDPGGQPVWLSLA
jgi:hypothetical protein